MYPNTYTYIYTFVHSCLHTKHKTPNKTHRWPNPYHIYGNEVNIQCAQCTICSIQYSSRITTNICTSIIYTYPCSTFYLLSYCKYKMYNEQCIMDMVFKCFCLLNIMVTISDLRLEVCYETWMNKYFGISLFSTVPGCFLERLMLNIIQILFQL